MKTKFWLSLAVILFLFGFVFVMVFNFGAVWTDLEGMSFWGYPEATSFDGWIESDIEVSSLSCPILLTSSEVATVKFRVTNAGETPIKPVVQASISKPGEQDDLIRNVQELALEPFESETFYWQISHENALENWAVYIRTYVYKTQYYPPSITRHCGIMVRNFGNLTGLQITLLITISSTVLMGLGLWIWWDNHKLLKQSNDHL
ncbi:MAG TPA: hypothetical protein PLA25_09170, partial [Anaerolineaceae bacterium]|nr:hypothetical protein [Anaerolineaceae bacterium]